MRYFSFSILFSLFLLSVVLYAQGGPDDAKPLRNRPPGPSLGAAAPDFTLPRLDLKDAAAAPDVHLADFREKSPVILVFGSYT